MSFTIVHFLQGWADFRYNNGTAATPNVLEWSKAPGTVVMQDFHTGGTVCSPTRATILTGRNHFRDCVDYVYGCSDMTECVPKFNFAPEHTYTVPMACRDSGKGYESFFAGKWHLYVLTLVCLCLELFIFLGLVAPCHLSHAHTRA